MPIGLPWLCASCTLRFSPTVTAAEALAIAHAIVTKRVHDEELSRGNMAKTPPSFLDVVDRHIATIQARQKERT
jgi:hypothetical protein